jgi:four helix bundle protein
MRNGSETPNTKHQAQEKHQTPSFTSLKSSVTRVDGLEPDALEAVGYPECSAEAWVLHEGPVRPDTNRHPFDLEERTARFGEAIVRFSKRIPREPSNNRLIDQLVGCGTSVGANYREANASVSGKDFRFSISRCVKEAKETEFFLRMVVASEPKLVEEARTLYREAHELLLIFASMFRKGRK